MHDRDRFDLIVSDLLMPGMNGIDSPDQSELSRAATSRSFLITASASPQDLVDARRAGVTAYMAKPFKLADLRDEVAAMLRASAYST